MNLDDLTIFLKNRVQLAMPGNTAHQKMKPQAIDGKRLRLKHENPPKKGGVLILLYQKGEKIYFPLIQRPIYLGIHSGQISLPGGKLEKKDKNQYDTALRETDEEIGVECKNIQVIGSLSEIFVEASNYMVLPVIGKINFQPNFLRELKEVDEIITPDIQQLMDFKNVKNKEMTFQNGLRMLCPYYHLKNRVVWGATAMMLSEFATILHEYASQKEKISSYPL